MGGLLMDIDDVGTTSTTDLFGCVLKCIRRSIFILCLDV